MREARAFRVEFLMRCYDLNGVGSLFESCVALQNVNKGIQAGNSRICIAQNNGFAGIRGYNGSLGQVAFRPTTDARALRLELIR